VLPDVERLPPPAALTLTDLKRRLPALRGSFPAALPPGAITTLGPERLSVGRTWLVLGGVKTLDGRPGWAVAHFDECPRGGAVWLEFDAAANAQYVLDASVAVGRYCVGPSLYPPPVPPFLVSVSEVGRPARGPLSDAVVQEVVMDGGHVLYAFRTGTNRRHRVLISFDQYDWSLYRVQLTRLPEP
jgi:hypothetical protein